MNEATALSNRTHGVLVGDAAGGGLTVRASTGHDLLGGVSLQSESIVTYR